MLGTALLDPHAAFADLAGKPDVEWHDNPTNFLPRSTLDTWALVIFHDLCASVPVFALDDCLLQFSRRVSPFRFNPKS